MLSDKDIDDTMAADWAKISEKYTAEEADAPIDDGADTSAAAPDKGAPAKGDDKETIPVSREADGKFKAQDKDKGAKPAVDKAAKPAAGETDAPHVDAAAGDAPDPALATRDVNKAPSSWKPLARAEWEKLSPAVRAEIHRREQDFQNGQSQLIPDAQLGKDIRQVIKPYEMMIQAEGGTPARAVADLFRTAAIFRVGSAQQKYQAVGQICRQFGVDLVAIGRAALAQQGGQANPQGGQQNPQPNPAQFHDPRVDQILAQQQRERQEATQRETQAMESTVTRWMNEADAQGNPKRPYLNDVINEMSALVAQLRQGDPTLSHVQALDRAYEAAIWAHPEVRQLLTQAQQTELDAKRRAENQTRVRDARRAGSVNVARRGSAPSPGKPGSMDETIRETARELGMIE